MKGVKVRGKVRGYNQNSYNRARWHEIKTKADMMDVEDATPIDVEKTVAHILTLLCQIEEQMFD